LSYCFSSYKAANIRQLIATSKKTGPVIRRFDQHLKTDRKLQCDRLTTDFRPDEYGRPYYALHNDGEEAYFGIYEANPDPLSASRTLVNRAASFFRLTEPSSSAKAVSRTPRRRLDRDLAAVTAAEEFDPDMPPPAIARAVERHAMKVAEEYLRRSGWTTIEDVSRRCSFDFYCQAGGRNPLRVEVKGTTGAGNSIPLTANEVRIARKRRLALVIVHNIRIDRQGKVAASGGIVEMIDRWLPADAEIEHTAHLWWRDSKPPVRQPRDV
jgi:hypothetical protein